MNWARGEQLLPFGIDPIMQLFDLIDHNPIVDWAAVKISNQ